MGVGVSNWRLAQTVSKLGQLGVVSGTALDSLFVRRLADGDQGGHMRRGLDAFPFPEMARRIWQEYFAPGGKPSEAPYPATPMHQRVNPRKLVELCMVSNFVEVFLAREGHKNPVGINYLEKVQMPHLSSLYGAMLAGVGYVLMGAGIPLHIPGVLDAFVAQHAAEYRLASNRRGAGARHDDASRSGRIRRRPPARAAPAKVSRHRLLKHAGHHHAAPGQRTRRRPRDRKPRRRAATMRRLAANSSSTPPASPSMASAIRSILPSCETLAFPSGWQAATEMPESFARRWSRARPECRWELHLRSAANRECGPT